MDNLLLEIEIDEILK